MAISLRTATFGTAASGAGFSVTLPTSTVAGDMLVVAVTNAGTAGPSAPTGWTLRYNASAGSGQFFSVYTATYSASLTLNFTNASSVAAWACDAYFEAGSVVYIDAVTSAINATNNTTMASPTATATGNVAGDYVVLAYGWTSSATISTVATGSTIDRTQANGSSCSTALGHANATLAANGASTAYSQTLSASNGRKSMVTLLLLAIPTPTVPFQPIDDFVGGAAGVLNTSKWSSWGSGQTMWASPPADGALLIGPSGASGSYGGILSVPPGSAATFVGRYAYIWFRSRLNNVAGTLQSFQIEVDGSNYIEIRHADGNLQANQNVAGTQTQIATIAWPGAGQDWVRIHESGGVTYWMYSATRGTWTLLVRRPNPITLTAAFINIYAGCYQAVASPGAAYFGYLNVPILTPNSASAGVASSSAALSRRRGLAGASAGVATVSVTLSRRRSLSAASAGVATASGALGRRRALVGASAGVAVVSGAIGATTPAPTVPSTAVLGTPLSLLGRIKLGAPLAVRAVLGLSGAAIGLATTTAVLSKYTARALSGASSGRATVAATLSARRALSGTSSGQATAVGTISRAPVSRNLSGSSSGQAVTSATLSARRSLLAASSDGRATTAAVIARLRALLGLSAGRATVAAALSKYTARFITGASNGSSSTSAAAIARKRALTGASSGLATVNVTLSVPPGQLVAWGELPLLVGGAYTPLTPIPVGSASADTGPPVAGGATAAVASLPTGSATTDTPPPLVGAARGGS